MENIKQIGKQFILRNITRIAAPDVLSESEGNQVCGIITDGSLRNKTQIEMRPINLFTIKVIYALI